MAFGDKGMTIQEFWQKGYIQEINRQMLHPIGLALNVSVPDGGGDAIAIGIFDCRDDPEGIIFGDSLQFEDSLRALELQMDAKERRKVREEALGFWIEPLPTLEPPPQE